jgi:hypothetical protein
LLKGFSVGDLFRQQYCKGWQVPIEIESRYG